MLTTVAIGLTAFSGWEAFEGRILAGDEQREFLADDLHANGSLFTYRRMFGYERKRHDRRVHLRC